MKEIVNKLQEKRNIEVAKSILESNGYNVSRPNTKENNSLIKKDSHSRRKSKVDESENRILRPESYRGLNIAPFREFTKVDYYGYAGANKIGNDEPLIFSGDNCDIIIAGDDEPLRCNISLYLGDDIGYYTEKSMSFPRALSLAKEIASIDGEYEKLVYWIEDNPNFKSY